METDKSWISSLFFCLCGASLSFAARAVYDVRDYGAKGDGKTPCTKAIQAAVDKCAATGGGTVYLPPGKWLSATIYMESHVTLFIDSGSTLLGSRNKDDYGRPPGNSRDDSKQSFSYRSIIAGADLQHIAIQGRGIIDGQGSAFRWKGGGRPKAIYLENCRDVLVEGLRMRNAGSWMQHYRSCDRLTVRDISVFNHASYNNDGLNIDSCRDVCITGCMVDSDDDAVVLKSLSLKPCENVTISDCAISSHCNAIKMGTESGGGFRNITITNCAICSPRYSKVTYGRQRGLAGIALEIVDGGILDRIAISNIAIKGVSVPIFMRLGNRARQYEQGTPEPGVGKFQNVVVSNIVATDTSSIGCSITGLPQHRIKNVSLSNISLGFEGGGTRQDASRQIPEKEKSYPESTMFGTLPAYGFYCRHVKGLKLKNVVLQTAGPDRRHALVCEDVEDAEIDALDAHYAKGGCAMVRLTNVKDVLVSGCRPKKGTDLFLGLKGSQSRRVLLMGNDFSGVDKIAEVAPDVPETALVKKANYTGEK